MRPVADKLIIEHIAEEKKLEGGLVWSDSDANKMRYQKARVVAKGPDVKVVNENDIIFYDKHRADETSIEGKIVRIIRESDVVVVLD